MGASPSIVDPAAIKAEVENVIEEIRLLQAVLGQQGEQDPDMWGLSLMGFIYRLCRLGAIKEAAVLAGTLPRAYLEFTLPRQMGEVPSLPGMALAVAQAFVDSGHVVRTVNLDMVNQPGVGKA